MWISVECKLGPEAEGEPVVLNTNNIVVIYDDGVRCTAGRYYWLDKIYIEQILDLIRTEQPMSKITLGD